jgi:hypothetical protein
VFCPECGVRIYHVLKSARRYLLSNPARLMTPVGSDQANSAAGQPTRLFSLFRGPDWTLLGYEADHAAVAPRPGLHVRTVGARGDLMDDAGHFRDAYGLSPGEWVLVRPDGYVGAIVSADMWSRHSAGLPTPSKSVIAALPPS